MQKISNYLKKKYSFLSLINRKALQIEKFNPLIFFSFLLIFSSIFLLPQHIGKADKNNQTFK